VQSLLKWFARQRRSASSRPQINELRLESDDRSVKVITIHMSKGLEFPIVFCPFCWEGLSARGQTEVFFHADQNGDQRLVDLGSEDLSRHQHLAVFETLAESLRLFYVAVTRAKIKCYVVWGRIKSAETSALGYLLHRPPAMDIDNGVDLLKKEIGNLTDADMLATLERLESTSNGRILIRTLPFDSEPTQYKGEQSVGNLSFRPFRGQINRSWSLTSYTALVDRQQPEHQLPGADDLSYFPTDMPGEQAIESESGDPGGQNQVAQFPRGVRPGIFFHSILQDLDFSDARPDHMRHLVNDRLRRYGYESKWGPPLCDHLRQLVDIPLLDSVPNLKLRRIQNKDRINEMAFTFPVNPITSDQLERILSITGPERTGADFQQTLKNIKLSAGQWFMNGFIDMVFCFQQRYYIVDWKSNHLGFETSAYGPDRLEKTMHTEMYVLQYLIYILALQRYLKLRNPGYQYENDFGGIFYIFLRGIDRQAGASQGIYYDRPPRELIEELDRLLIPAKEAD
jgi:exodeoxyribonuclease V beta subunit